MGGFSNNPDTQLLIDLARLGVDEGSRKAMRQFFAALPEEQKVRTLQILGSEDEDLARLVVATVPAMQGALHGKGKSLIDVFKSAVSFLHSSS
jgi:hypothetical protein